MSDLADMYALSLWVCGPSALSIHIKQITHAYVTTIIATYSLNILKNNQLKLSSHIRIRGFLCSMHIIKHIHCSGQHLEYANVRKHRFN